MARSSSDSSGCAGSDAVRKILSATSLFGRLQLPDAAVEISTLKSRYRQLALLVHPDKCSHNLAKEAFQKLSEAFDGLSNEAAQRQHLAKDRQAQSNARTRHKRKDKDRWWDTQTWAEFEQRFRHRDAAEAALLKEYANNVKAKHSMKRVRSQVLAAERSIEQCDRGAGYPESELWPPELRLEAGAAERAVVEHTGRPDTSQPQGFDERPELEHPATAFARLLDLITHLRTVHRYCMYCGCVFDSFEDLERNCPGFTEEEHDNAPNTAARTSKETAVGLADQLAVFEEDPLDAFMGGLQDQLHKDLKSSVKSAKKRDQTQKGWSFEQQSQQNRNERKSSKRSR